MEERKDPNVLEDGELDPVAGGVMRTVNTKMAVDAVVRSGPGTQYPQAGTLSNGTQVNTTANSSYNALDGRTWYEINYPMYGWMAGSLLGYY